MKTNYRIVRTNTENEGYRFAIHRCYYTDEGVEMAVDDEPARVTASNPLRLRALINEAFKLPFIDG